MQKDCPSKWAYIAIEDGGYFSTSDVEDNIEDEAVPDDDQDDDGPSFGNNNMMNYRAIIV